jgi:hypothetical protein
MSWRGFEKTRRWMQRVREEYTSLSSWWLHEMREAFADLKQRLAPGRPHRTTISLSRTAGTVVQQWRNGTIKSAEFQRTQTGDLPADRSEFWPAATTDAATAHVVLPKSAILMRRIWLPANAEHNLTPLVELQLERELPIPRDQVHVDWRIEARNRDRTKIEVVIGIVWRSEIERLVSAMSQWKLRVASIAVDQDGDAPSFNFAPRRTRRSTSRLARVDRLLVISAAIFWLAYAGVIGAQWMRERIVVTEALAEMTAPTLRVEHMRAELDQRRRPMLTLLQLMAAPSSAEVLADLTAAVPRDSWLQQLEIRSLDDNSSLIKLTAITPTATQLVNQLEQSPRFENVALQSAGTMGLGMARDRAELSARWLKPSVEAGAQATKP